MQKIEVFDGNELKKLPPNKCIDKPLCCFEGYSDNGTDISVPISEALLSTHLMLLGGIGTGKTNTFNQIIQQIRSSFSENDIMIVFDTKGDFYKKFYRPGDIVISNDSTATGPSGPDYWNIFNEIENDEHMEENIVEISKTLFYEKSAILTRRFSERRKGSVFRYFDPLLRKHGSEKQQRRAQKILGRLSNRRNTGNAQATRKLESYGKLYLR